MKLQISVEKSLESSYLRFNNGYGSNSSTVSNTIFSSDNLSALSFCIYSVQSTNTKFTLS